MINIDNVYDVNRLLSDKNFKKEAIEENLRLVELGEPLNIPLSLLNGEFKQQYFHPNKLKKLLCIICKKQFKQKRISQVCCSKNCTKAHQKAYYQRPEVKAHQKAYYQRPEVKAHQKAYYQRPEVKAHQKAYYQRNKKNVK
jgi:hypothetical protein